jgi:[NiFe] hydrogenase diaphorase moiety small subunit
MNTAPASDSFNLDGHTLSFRAGETVMQAALAAGVNIPHLCYRPELEPIGSCRVCLVEVGGRKLSACTLQAEAGQDIASNTEALRALRRNIVKMLFQQGRHFCISCERTGDCRLQEAAVELQTPSVEPAPAENFPERDDSHPDVALDRSRCIVCGVCIQASRELDGTSLFAFGGSGAETHLIVASASGQLHDSGIAATDFAVRLCPVGALIPKRPVAEANTFGASSFDFADFGDWGR